MRNAAIRAALQDRPLTGRPAARLAVARRRATTTIHSMPATYGPTARRPHSR